MVIGTILMCTREIKHAEGQQIARASRFSVFAGGRGLWFCVSGLRGELVRSQFSWVRIPLPSPLPVSPG